MVVFDGLKLETVHTLRLSASTVVQMRYNAGPLQGWDRKDWHDPCYGVSSMFPEILCVEILQGHERGETIKEKDKKAISYVLGTVFGKVDLKVVYR
jgi:hypothetical protein